VTCRLNNATGPHALRFLYAITLVVVIEVARRGKGVIEGGRYGSSQWCGRASTLKIESVPASGRRELWRLRYPVRDEERMQWRESCERHKERAGTIGPSAALPTPITTGERRAARLGPLRRALT
jgi:hypothetical protein